MSQIAVATVRRWPPKRVRQVRRDVLVYLVLLAGSLVLMSPLIWMISTSLKAPGKELTFPPQLIPAPVRWQNYVEIWTFKPFGLYFYNSFVITLLATLGSVLSSSLVAFGFARLRFFGRDFLFMLVLATLMLPAIVTLLPMFLLFREINWLDTFLPLIVPSWLSQGAYGQGGFYIFLMRQFFLTLPYELDEAARADGASALQIYWNVLLPLCVPSLTAVAIFAFLANWNDFLYPLVFLLSPDNLTIALGVRTMSTLELTERGTPWGLMMTISLLMLIPPMVVLLVGQRYFVRGIALSGLAGR